MFFKLDMKGEFVGKKNGLFAQTLLFFVLLCLQPLFAQQEAPADSLLSISLTDGTELQGRIIESSETTYTILTPAGLEVKVPKTAVLKLTPVRGEIVEGKFRRFDPNYSRLLYAPTGRPLRQGEGYFSDIWVFFPSVAYGFTDNFTLIAGFSVIPGLGITDQLKYFAPKVGFQPGKDFAFSVGALYMTVHDVAAGIAFATGSIGQQDKSFTLGLGMGYTKTEGGKFEFAEHPVIMLGGKIRISNSLALVSENWFITGRKFDLGEQPFGLVLRFFGKHIAVDAGAIIILDILDKGFPIPWLSFTYNFGK